MTDPIPATANQPAPTEGREVWPEVIRRWREDPPDGSEPWAPSDAVLRILAEMVIAEDARAKYDQPLYAHNGQDGLIHAWQEALDLRVYLEQARIEQGEAGEARFDALIDLADDLLVRLAAASFGPVTPSATPIGWLDEDEARDLLRHALRAGVPRGGIAQVLAALIDWRIMLPGPAGIVIEAIDDHAARQLSDLVASAGSLVGSLLRRGGWDAARRQRRALRQQWRRLRSNRRMREDPRL